jgi:hypothetical protein
MIISRMDSSDTKKEVKSGNAVSTMTKKRYFEIQKILCAHVTPDEMEGVMSNIKSIMNFDPDKKLYDEGYGRRQKEWNARERRKNAELSSK